MLPGYLTSLPSVLFGSYAHIHNYTYTHTKPFNSQDYLGKLVPEETFTHSHSSWSWDIIYQLPPSTTIHSILFVQFMCLTVLFYNIFPGPLWSSSWSWTLYFILHDICIIPISASLLAEVPPHFLSLQDRTHFHATYCFTFAHNTLPLIINDTSLLVSSGTNCLNLFHPIRILAWFGC